MADKESKSVSDAMTKAMLSGDLDGFLACYAKDAVLYGPGPVVESHGHDGIRAEMTGFFQAIQADSFEWDDRCDVAGDVAYHWGTWTLTGRNKITGEALTARARTLDVRRRQPDGTWKIVVDHASWFPPST